MNNTAKHSKLLCTWWGSKWTGKWRSGFDFIVGSFARGSCSKLCYWIKWNCLCFNKWFNCNFPWGYSVILLVFYYNLAISWWLHNTRLAASLCAVLFFSSRRDHGHNEMIHFFTPSKFDFLCIVLRPYLQGHKVWWTRPPDHGNQKQPSVKKLRPIACANADQLELQHTFKCSREFKQLGWRFKLQSDDQTRFFKPLTRFFAQRTHTLTWSCSPCPPICFSSSCFAEVQQLEEIVWLKSAETFCNIISPSNV